MVRQRETWSEAESAGQALRLDSVCLLVFESLLFVAVSALASLSDPQLLLCLFLRLHIWRGAGTRNSSQPGTCARERGSSHVTGLCWDWRALCQRKMTEGCMRGEDETGELCLDRRVIWVMITEHQQRPQGLLLSMQNKHLYMLKYLIQYTYFNLQRPCCLRYTRSVCYTARLNNSHP